MADLGKGVKTRRSLFASPPSTVKAPKKAKTVSNCNKDSRNLSGEMEEGGRRQGTSSDPLMDISSIHEIILTRVTEALSIFKPVEGTEADPIMKAIPVIATAVSVAVGEALKGMMREVEERLHPQYSPREDRLFTAVRSLTFENDRLQQYSRRESLRIFGIPYR